MRFVDTRVAGAKVLELQPIRDDRGFFGRLLCDRELAEQGLKSCSVQTNVGFSLRRGTLRGLHYQRPPHAEVKILRCTRGRVFDVVVDLRPDSPSYLAWDATELSAGNHRALYVPAGCATGYLTLEDDCEVYYHTSDFYAPESATGVRWDDPAFGIEWPERPVIISQQDRDWPDMPANPSV